MRCACFVDVCVCITVIACSKMFFNDNFLPFRSVKMKITTRDCFRCSVVSFIVGFCGMLPRWSWFVTTAIIARISARLTRALVPNSPKACLLTGTKVSLPRSSCLERFLSLSLSLVIKKLSYISSLNDKKFLAKNC